MAEAICKRVWEQRARQKEPAEKASSSSESEEDPVEELSSSSKSNPVTLSSNSLEEEYEGLTTSSRPDDDPDLWLAPAHILVTHSTPKKLTSRPKQKVYKSKATEPRSGSRKRSKGHD